MVPEPFEVIAKRQDTADTWTLELEPRSERAARVRPGPVHDALGRRRRRGADLDQRRSRPAASGSCTRSAPSAWRPQAICAAEPGRVLGVRGPFGAAVAGRGARGRATSSIVAGGIGLAPLRPAILRLLARRERYGRLVLLYGGRSPDQLLYTDELAAWPERGLEVLVTVDSAGPEWLGHVGVVTTLVRRAELDPSATVAMVCGPEVMMRFTVAALLDARGAAGADLRVDGAQHAVRRSASAAIASSARRSSAGTGRSYRCVGIVEPWLAIQGAVMDAARASPTLAVWKFASCDGCQLSLLDCEDELLALAGRRRDRLLPRGHPARRRGPVRRVAGRGLDHHARTTRSGSARSAPARGR